MEGRLIEYCASCTVSRKPCKRADEVVVECYICNETGHYSNSCPWRRMADGTEMRPAELGGRGRRGCVGCTDNAMATRWRVVRCGAMYILYCSVLCSLMLLIMPIL